MKAVKGVFLTNEYDEDPAPACRECALGSGTGLSHDEAVEALEYEFAADAPAQCPCCGRGMIAYDTERARR
jgi:hypothetical protein